MRGIGKLRALLSAAANVRTVVVDRSMSQYNASRGMYPNDLFIFCCFQILRDIWRKASELGWVF